MKLEHRRQKVVTVRHSGIGPVVERIQHQQS
jgi:hypothetical protein